ncbi:MAG: flagellar motor protein MotB [Gammaproteobacteria bacterium]|nr:flagellar motor protein MotB [Gammaproteobacteria bacterium]
MSEQTAQKKCPPAGAPAWMATFADLMSLLMCFFVLLLSFSEMDVLKFKQLAGSMKEAFGVQRDIKTKEIPKGTSIISKEFSPGKPVPTKIRILKQNTTDRPKRNIKFTDSNSINNKAREEIKKELEKETQKKINESTKRIKAALKQEISKGTIEVVGKNQEIIIRISEKGSFPSGSATLNKSFEKIMKKISFLVKSTPGDIIVSGHTDNIPIYTYLFRSNWELSSSRAVSVLKSIINAQNIQASRLSVQGHADTKPLESNNTAAGRAKNRRVEIKIRQSATPVEDKILDIKNYNEEEK